MDEKLKLEMDNAVKALNIAQVCLERALARVKGEVPVARLRVVK